MVDEVKTPAPVVAVIPATPVAKVIEPVVKAQDTPGATKDYRLVGVKHGSYETGDKVPLTLSQFESFKDKFVEWFEETFEGKAPPDTAAKSNLGTRTISA